MHERWITHRRAGWTVRSLASGPSPAARLVAAGVCLGMLFGTLGSLLTGVGDQGMHRDVFEPDTTVRRGWTPEDPGCRPHLVDLRPHLPARR